MLMMAGNPYESWDIRLWVERLLGRFATTTAALLPDYMNNSQIALLESPHTSIAEQP
jgi:hypothetical protein